jgi:hypothetical protein
MDDGQPSATWSWVTQPGWVGWVLYHGARLAGFVERTGIDPATLVYGWQPYAATGQPLTTQPLTFMESARVAVEQDARIPAAAIAYDGRAVGRARPTA